MAAWIRQFIAKRLNDVEMVALHLVGKLPVHVVRIVSLRLFGATISPKAILYHGFEVRSARRLTIGDRANIGNDAILDARGGLTIDADVNLSTGVHIWTGQHDWRAPDFDYVSAPVHIHEHAWLGDGVTVLPGVTIGRNAVVAARSVVTKSVAENIVVAGIPAKEVARRDDMHYRLATPRQKPWWW